MKGWIGRQRRRDGSVWGRRGSGGRSARVLNVEFHVIGVKRTLVVRGDNGNLCIWEVGHRLSLGSRDCLGKVIERCLRGIRVNNHDMTLLEVIYECVHVCEVHSAALVIAALVDVRAMRCCSEPKEE